MLEVMESQWVKLQNHMIILKHLAINSNAGGQNVHEPTITVNGKLKVIDELTYLGITLSTVNYTFMVRSLPELVRYLEKKKVQVGKDQEKAQSEKDSHFKNRGGKKPN